MHRTLRDEDMSTRQRVGAMDDCQLPLVLPDGQHTSNADYVAWKIYGLLTARITPTSLRPPSVLSRLRHKRSERVCFLTYRVAFCNLSFPSYPTQPKPPTLPGGIPTARLGQSHSLGTFAASPWLLCCGTIFAGIVRRERSQAAETIILSRRASSQAPSTGGQQFEPGTGPALTSSASLYLYTFLDIYIPLQDGCHKCSSSLS
ncbi:hypothetical protein PYCCODRAFT_978456 [Trametes coccinea BRFM310]|uniref:Uncharacterized protein n=1 Tax=Trametes coccinea (strain BRFM310) TaxID=1353009 RepID=A0A1Y2IBX0_TRAC3|nr:hypothetical protein PYCCODRAFT_978456 [Trametes coccinea BRFM310]